jgi:ABC-type transport system involved in multi-copper enzyme maturation permease subunit
MNWWSELVTQNPMLIEIPRFRRRMLSGRDGGGNRAVLVLILVFYLLILVTILRFSKDIDPVWIIEFQTGLFTLLLPVMSAGAIAGEREHRTWDILLTAPVTKAQIVVGKFIAILAGYGIFLAACGLMVVSCMIANPNARVGLTLSAELLSVTFAMMLIALSLYISARSRTTFAAIGACVGFVFVVYGAAPIFIGSLFQRAGADFLELTYPFVAMYKLADTTDSKWDAIRWSVPLCHDAIYLLLAAALLAGATVTVRRMEEIKDFMPEPETKVGKARA